MNTNNKKGNSAVWLVVAGLGLALLAVGLVAAFQSGKNEGVGSTLTYSAALGRIETYNFLDGIVQDVRNLASSTGHGLRATATWDPPALSSASTTVASTTVTVSGAALGDFVLASFGSGTSSESWHVVGKVRLADSVTVFLSYIASSTAALNLSSETVYLKVFQQEEAPVVSATTTAANR